MKEIRPEGEIQKINLDPDQIMRRFKEAKRKKYKETYKGKDVRNRERRFYLETEASREKTEEGTSLGYIDGGTDPIRFEADGRLWGFSEYEE